MKEERLSVLCAKFTAILDYETSVLYIMARHKRQVVFSRRVLQDSGPSYMVSGTRDNPSPEVTLSSVYM